jgi:hypothetical protein
LYADSYRKPHESISAVRYLFLVNILNLCTYHCSNYIFFPHTLQSAIQLLYDAQPIYFHYSRILRINTKLPTVIINVLFSHSILTPGYLKGMRGLEEAHATPSRGRTHVKARRQHFHSQDVAVVICLRICCYDYCKYGAMRRRRAVGSARYEIQRVFITSLAKLLTDCT